MVPRPDIRTQDRVDARLPSGVWLLIVGTFAIHLGSYMVIPYLMVLLPQDFAVPTMVAAALVFVVKLSVKGSSVIGGPLADRLGTRRLMVIGLTLRGVGMAAFAISQSIWWLFALSIIAGLGTGFYGPATRGAIGFLTPEDLQKHAFSLRAVAANLGMALAPLGVFFLAGTHVNLIFLLSGALFLLLGALTWVWLPEIPVHTTESLAHILRGVAGDRRWRIFGALIVGSWFLYGHLDTTIIVWANQWGGLGGMTSIAAIYALAVALLQTPMTRFVGTRLSNWHHVTVGTGLSALGLITIGLVSNFSGAILAILFFALGATLLVPGADLVTSDMAPKGRINSYFGTASLFSTVGMSSSAPIGAYLTQLWPESSLPWWLMAGCGLLLTAALALWPQSPRTGGQSTN